MVREWRLGRLVRERYVGLIVTYAPGWDDEIHVSVHAGRPVSVRLRLVFRHLGRRPRPW